MNDVFGFSTEPRGDFPPIIKYDARSGRISRPDREDTGQGFITTPVDITKEFKAIFDLENLATGWLDFPAGGAPVMTLVPLADLTAGKTPMPNKPTPRAKNGVRLMVKLAKSIAGQVAVRELAGNSRVFVEGMKSLYVAWQAKAAANPGKLPVVVLKDAMPVKTSGKNESGQPVTTTNYQPVFEIVDWAPRGDFVHVPRGAPAAAPAAAAPAPAPEPAFPKPMPPSTGSTRVEAPAARKEEMATAEDDFG